MGLKRIWHGVGVQQITLGDDSKGEKISLGLPEQSRPGIEHWTPYDAEFQRVFDNGGILNGRVWRVDRDHGSERNAVNFLETHNDDIETLGFLELISDTGSKRYLVNASIVPRCVTWDGQSTVWEYTVRGGAIQTQRPTS